MIRMTRWQELSLELSHLILLTTFEVGGVNTPVLQTRNPGLTVENHLPEEGKGIQVAVPAMSGRQSLLPCLGRGREARWLGQGGGAHLEEPENGERHRHHHHNRVRLIREGFLEEPRLLFF